MKDQIKISTHIDGNDVLNFRIYKQREPNIIEEFVNVPFYEILPLVATLTFGFHDVLKKLEG